MRNPSALRLLLLRHAKSSWKDGSLADHDRPLARRGVRAARAMGEHLAEHAGRIDLALVSSARRARETQRLLALAAPTRFERGLYLATAEELLARIARVSDRVRCLLVVGHNPGLEDLTRALTGEARALASRRLARGLKTASLAELEPLARRWSELRPGGACLVRVTRPRDLP